MTPEEATTVYNELRSYLIENKLRWLADQIDDEVARGKTGRKELSAPSERLVRQDPITRGRPRQTSRTKATFLTTEPFEPKEALKIMIDAIETIVIGGVLIHNRITETLRPAAQPTEIYFSSERPGDTGHVLSYSEFARRISASNKLKELLIELKKEAGYAA
ncbi:hypothetical protein [Azospirillum sp. SYSU D00513]|uniref:hypothetical protein n=1 Tax=Azospirillum sp. SYSU D00513 TaxID=2812561 RepID=UPI001A957698|nr:hypothetical protein [Azospirillum sp. SYSU D00513]